MPRAMAALRRRARRRQSRPRPHPDRFQAATGRLRRRSPRRLLHDGAAGGAAAAAARPRRASAAPRWRRSRPTWPPRAAAEGVRRADGEADVFLTEIKAAAVDVVAEAAAAPGKELVFCDNEPVAEGRDLGAVVDRLAALAAGARGGRDHGRRRRCRHHGGRRRGAVQQGPDGAGAHGHRPAARARLRRRGGRGAAPATPRAGGPHPARPREIATAVAGAAATARTPSRAFASGRTCASSPSRSSCWSAAAPAWARAPWPPSSPIAWASPAWSPPTRCARSCAPSSPPTSCPRSSTRRSRPPAACASRCPRERRRRGGLHRAGQGHRGGRQRRRRPRHHRGQAHHHRGRAHRARLSRPQPLEAAAVVVRSCSPSATSTPSQPLLRARVGDRRHPPAARATWSTSRRSAASRSTSCRAPRVRRAGHRQHRPGRRARARCWV